MRLQSDLPSKKFYFARGIPKDFKCVYIILITTCICQISGVLDLILEKRPDWILYQDEEQKTPLHWAASMGYLEGVRNLLGKNTSTAMERDKDGFFPIHTASAKGHVCREFNQKFLTCEKQNK